VVGSGCGERPESAQSGHRRLLERKGSRPGVITDWNAASPRAMARGRKVWSERDPVSGEMRPRALKAMRQQPKRREPELTALPDRAASASISRTVFRQTSTLARTERRRPAITSRYSRSDGGSKPCREGSRSRALFHQ